MQDFEESSIPDDQYQKVYTETMEKWDAGEPAVRKQFAAATRDLASFQIKAFVDDIRKETVYLNDQYQVNVRHIEHSFYHLSIKRIDKEAIHDWRDLQEIKNKLLGPECEAVEVYPKESRLVDTANQYHLWGWKDPKYRLPFGFGDRYVTDTPGGNAKNRKFKKNT